MSCKVMKYHFLDLLLDEEESMKAEKNNSFVESFVREKPRLVTNIEPQGVRPRKPCNCTKSQCLKLYCDCFANGKGSINLFLTLLTRISQGSFVTTVTVMDASII